MTLKSFLIGMLASFGFAWMFVIAIPTVKMSKLPAVKMNAEEDAAYYQRRASGRLVNGAEVYASNGCYTCHSQLIRPTYAGRQIWRDDVAGIFIPDEKIDTRRETSVHDFDGEKYAQIGLTRMGPDLSNVGHRADRYAAEYAAATGEKMSSEQWLLAHLRNPRNSELQRGDNGEKIDMTWSNCPSQPQLFAGDDHLKPKDQALALASYLMSLKRDDTLPDAMKNPAEGDDKEEESK